ncbi:MAG: iron-sulfur cluster repair di-iron protein [Bryobacteraceae bacterium]
METETKPMTVGEIAKESPSAVRVFEKHKIDYCCGGKRPLAEVCQELGLSADDVLQEVRESGRVRVSGRNWADAPLAELISHIVAAHHAYLKSELPVLSARMDKVAEKHSQNSPQIFPALAEVFRSLAEELGLHLHKEEMILFPLIEKIEAARNAGRAPAPSHCGSVANPIRVMVAEHDNAGHALAEMRRLTGGYTPPPDACVTFLVLYDGLAQLEADLHTHIHLENNILFPRAVELEG